MLFCIVNLPLTQQKTESISPWNLSMGTDPWPIEYNGISFTMELIWIGAS